MRSKCEKLVSAVLIGMIGLTIIVIGWQWRIHSVEGVDEIVSETEEDLQQRMYQVATEKMEDLQAGNWSHTNLDGCDLGCRTKRHGTSHLYYGENLYRGVCSINTMYRMWMESPSHKEVLESNYRYAVLLVEPDGNGGCYAVLNVMDIKNEKD